MVDTESSGSETNLVVHSARYTCRAQISSKESKEIVFHNAEPWYPAKFGLAKKPRRFFCVLRLQEVVKVTIRFFEQTLRLDYGGRGLVRLDNSLSEQRRLDLYWVSKVTL
jgi:hypothetical protein